MQAARTFYGEIFVLAVLVLVTALLFWPVRQHDFINYDDPDYITANPIVQNALTAEGIKWAFASSHSYNWHPITWVSHMMDVQFFGMDPGKHHLASLAWHILNALLLFWLLRQATKSLWASAMIAAVFAWHPLHVESVAWACERKDVLSTFFWLLTTIFYVRHVHRSQLPGARSHSNYVLALTCFALGLMSKPMLVTLPFTLLLLDYWPLKRISNPFHYRTLKSEKASRLLWEKLPFFVLTIASCIITYLAQRKEGAVVDLQHLPLGARFANAIVSYARYIGKTLIPSDLSIHYQPVQWSATQVVIALALVLLFSAAALWLARDQPFIFVGWFWFIGTLIPVIGIVQVGAQAIADRYMYVPMIGLSIAIVWPFVHWARRRERLSIVFAGIAVACLVGNLLASSRQIRHWRNSQTIFEHAIAVDPTNVVARVMLANTLLAQERFADAQVHFEKALEANPNFPEVHFNLGNLFVQANRVPEAIAAYEKALELNPTYPEAHANLGVALGMERRFEEAIAHYEKSLELQPLQPDLLRNLALDLIQLGRLAEADATLQRALEIDPSDATAHFLLGTVYQARGQTQEALTRYERALALRPEFAEARERLMALQGN